MKLAIGKTAYEALYRLARAHGHAWTYYASSDDRELSEREETAILKCSIDRAQDEAEDASDRIAGIRFDTRHTTASGRISWRLNGDRFTICAWRSAVVFGGLDTDHDPERSALLVARAIFNVRTEAVLETIETGCAISEGSAIAFFDAIEACDFTALLPIDLRQGLQRYISRELLLSIALQASGHSDHSEEFRALTEAINDRDPKRRCGLLEVLENVRNPRPPRFVGRGPTPL